MGQVKTMLDFMVRKPVKAQKHGQLYWKCVEFQESQREMVQKMAQSEKVFDLEAASKPLTQEEIDQMFTHYESTGRVPGDRTLPLDPAIGKQTNFDPEAFTDARQALQSEPGDGTDGPA